jgi:polyisoprenoid-binding protein YceI
MFVATRTVLPMGTWSVDPAHSSVEFAVKHLGIATVHRAGARHGLGCLRRHQRGVT